MSRDERMALLEQAKRHESAAGALLGLDRSSREPEPDEVAKAHAHAALALTMRLGAAQQSSGRLGVAAP